LTLEYALEFADRNHPEVAAVLADVNAARADAMEARSRDDIDISAEGRARYIGVKGESGAVEDHAIGVSVTKRLYDFGYTHNQVRAAETEQAGQDWFYREAWHDHLLAIMRSYFDVLLADLEFVYENEAMSMAYVRLDRARRRQELGKVSGVTVAGLERVYQHARRKRSASELQQRTARARLALRLNRPGQLSSGLETPDLSRAIGPLPPVEELQARALQDNPGLRGLREQVEAARLRVEAARDSDNPVIGAEFGALTQSRELQSREDMRAGLTLEVPLYRGGRRAAAVAREQAGFQGLLARLRQGEMEVRQGILETVTDIAELEIQRDEMASLDVLRDMELERNRALYEMEVATDFGDAMARQSEARLLSTRTQFRLFMERARLAALLGEDPAALLVRRGNDEQD